MTDRYPPITSQTRYPQHHAASIHSRLYFNEYTCDVFWSTVGTQFLLISRHI